MLSIENIKPTWKHNIINQNSVRVNFYVGGRAVEFGQRAIYWSQTCVRVCGMFFLLSQIVLPLRCIPNEIPQISCRAFIWNFPKFQTSFCILFQYCSSAAFLQLLRGSRASSSVIFLTDPCLFLATYSEKFRLIFLFKWTAEEEPSGTIVQDSRLDNIFFAKQVWNCLESPGSVRGKY